MTVLAGSLEHLSSVFRYAVGRQVEYSFTADPSWLGVMVVGTGPQFLAGASEVARPFLHRARWQAIGAELAARLAPDVIGFRADCHGTRVERATIYLRLRAGTLERTLEQALSAAAADVWAVPSPHRLARLVGARGPSILSVRLSRAGEIQMSAYFDLPPSRQLFRSRLWQLMSELEMPSSSYHQLEWTLSKLQLDVQPSVIGVDAADAPSDRAIKLDYPGPRVEELLAALQRIDTPTPAAEQLAQIAISLRRTTFTYFGSKFGIRGFQGWKAYVQVWASSPGMAVPASPRLFLGDDPGAKQ